jgi:hypothetical protein
MPDSPANLEHLLDRLMSAAEDRDPVPLGRIFESIGNRSFGPLLLAAGVILVSPLSAIPGMATLMGLFVFAIAVQLLIARRHFWLPGWLLRRSVARAGLEKSVRRIRPSARVVDRYIRPRLRIAVQGAGLHLIALLCVILAAAMPMMELVPFSASAAGFALTAFGLALTARDGFLAVVAVLSTSLTSCLIVTTLL